MGRPVGMFVTNDFALFTERAGDEGYLHSLGHIFGHGGTRPDRFVIGMSMDEQEAAI